MIKNSFFRCNSSKENDSKIINLIINIEDNIESNIEIKKELDIIKDKKTFKLYPDDVKEENKKVKEPIISHKIQSKYKAKFFSNSINSILNKNNSKNNISVKSNDACEKLIYFTNLNDKKNNSGISTSIISKNNEKYI